MKKILCSRRREPPVVDIRCSHRLPAQPLLCTSGSATTTWKFEPLQCLSRSHRCAALANSPSHRWRYVTLATKRTFPQGFSFPLKRLSTPSATLFRGCRPARQGGPADAGYRRCGSPAQGPAASSRQSGAQRCPRPGTAFPRQHRRHMCGHHASHPQIRLPTYPLGAENTQNGLRKSFLIKPPISGSYIGRRCYVHPSGQVSG